MTIATMPLIEYGKPTQESEATLVSQIQTQKLQQAEEIKAPKLVAAESTKATKAVFTNKGTDTSREAKPKPWTAKEEYEISIHEAAWKGNIKAIEQHLAAGKDVNAKDDLYGDTPLLWATGFGHKEVIEMLIAKGADVNAKAEEGWTPIHYATGVNDKEIIKLLIAKGVRLPPILGPQA